MASIKIEKQLGETKRAVIKGLVAYNTQRAGKMGYVPVSVSLREKGKIVSGVVGEIFFGWMFVSLFWIDDKHRGKGFGQRLLEATEAQARKNGVKNVYLDTFSFQAPGFYKKRGYREFGRLKEYPAGHDRVWMTKAL
ncbi:MAG: GNAT family N-acetyltransferase [Xanthobacteraceae bacterium]